MSDPASATWSRALPARAERPAGLVVRAVRAAEQRVLVVVGEADLHPAPQRRRPPSELPQSRLLPVAVELGALELVDVTPARASRSAPATASTAARPARSAPELHSGKGVRTG